MSLGLSLGLSLGTQRGAAQPVQSIDFTTGSLPAAVTFSRASTGSVVNALGVLESAAIDAPRFDHNPVSLAAKGLLIEEARTNLLTFSEQLDNAAWTKTGATLTANAAVSPNGGTNADSAAATGTNVSLFNVVTLTPDTVYSSSIFGKRISGSDWYYLRGRLNSGGNVFLWSNLTTGVKGATSGSPIANDLNPAPNGYYRLSLTYSSASGATAPYVFCSPAASDGNGNCQIGDTVLPWGAQIEQGAFSTSYIPTTGSSASRAADVAQITGSNFTAFYNAAQGSFVVSATSPASGNRTILALDDGTANEQIILQTQGTAVHLIVIDGGVTVADINLGTITANTPFKVAFRYQANNCGGSLNGAAVVSDTSVTLPTVDRLRYGASQAGEQLCGYIVSESYFNEALADSRLRALAT